MRSTNGRLESTRQAVATKKNGEDNKTPAQV